MVPPRMRDLHRPEERRPTPPDRQYIGQPCWQMKLQNRVDVWKEEVMKKVGYFLGLLIADCGGCGGEFVDLEIGLWMWTERALVRG